MELMLVSEALQEKNIADIAEDIYNSGKRIVLIAGPSSSGKTTFSHRLSVQLRAKEMCIRDRSASCCKYCQTLCGPWNDVSGSDSGRKSWPDEGCGEI